MKFCFLKYVCWRSIQYNANKDSLKFAFYNYNIYQAFEPPDSS